MWQLCGWRAGEGGLLCVESESWLGMCVSYRAPAALRVDCMFDFDASCLFGVEGMW